MQSQFRRQSVFITGTSSGIGRATAQGLARDGFRVFAGVRRAEDAAALRGESLGIEPIEIDITQADSIRAAAERLRAEVGSDGLHGLVNNAGIGIAVPIEHVALEVLRHHFEVDVFGQIAVTQAFLPLIRQATGRIVNMGSVGGHIAMPFGGVLCGCKSALRAMNDALRLELHPFGIHVSLIEPGAINTPAADKTLGEVERTISELPPQGVVRYARMLREFTRRAYETESRGSPPEVVARAVHLALTAARPLAHYPVGKNALLLTALPRLLPERILDRIRLRIFGMPSEFGKLVAHPL